MDNKFAETVLHSIFDKTFTSVTILGTTAYMSLGGPTRAKIELTESGFDVSILSLSAGVIDKKFLSFAYILGLRPSKNPERKDGIVPYIFVTKDGYGTELKTIWYDYTPDDNDYQLMLQCIQHYITVFKP